MPLSDALVIDCDLTELADVQAWLARCAEADVVSWSRPMASPADRSGRRTLYGYTRPGFGGHGLPGHALVRRMLEGGRAIAPSIAVAHTSLLNDPATLILDFTSVAALRDVGGMWVHLLLLTPKRGAVLTSAAHATWETVLTRQAQQGGDAITNLSWRHSTRGGRA